MNILEKVTEAEKILTEMKEICNTVEYRKNKGLPKDGTLVIELANRKRRVNAILDSLKFR